MDYFTGAAVIKYDKESCSVTYCGGQKSEMEYPEPSSLRRCSGRTCSRPLSFWDFLGLWQCTAILCTLFFLCVSVSKVPLFIDMPYRIRKEHVSLEYGLNTCDDFISK